MTNSWTVTKSAKNVVNIHRSSPRRFPQAVYCRVLVGRCPRRYSRGRSVRLPRTSRVLEVSLRSGRVQRLGSPYHSTGSTNDSLPFHSPPHHVALSSPDLVVRDTAMTYIPRLRAACPQQCVHEEGCVCTVEYQERFCPFCNKQIPRGQRCYASGGYVGYNCPVDSQLSSP